MRYSEFDAEDVRGWIGDIADACTDPDQYDEDTEMDARIVDQINSYISSNRDALMVIAYYGAYDYVGGCDFEDSPLAQFEQDIYDEISRRIGSD